MNKHLSLIILILAIIFIPSCLSALQKACLDSLPVLTQGQAYGTDAIAAIDQAEAAAANMPLPADVKAALETALDDARRGVEVGEIAVSAAIQICTAKDSVAMYQDFISAWGKIESILAGNDAAKLKLAKKPLYVPAIVRLARTAAPQK
jgi:hypothetical protein